MSIASRAGTLPAKMTWTRVLLSWLLGSLAAYFLTSFFSNFYSFAYQFVLLSLLFQWLCGTAAFLFLDDIAQETPAEQHIDPFAVLALAIAFALSLAALAVSWQFPGLFHRWLFFMDLSRLPFFVLLSALCLGAAGLLFKRVEAARFAERFEGTFLFKFIRENRAGLLLAIFFFAAYLVFTESLNFPGFRTLDQYFDTDISEWLVRLTATMPVDSVVRAVHPAVLLFLRPVVWLLSLFLNGDRLQAVFLMNALAGAACVLLAWLIVKRASGQTAYSLILASLLGASASHLLFSAMLETYIYSALALLLFTFLIQRERTSLRYTAPAGILVFGITITNIIQTCILYFFNFPRLKVMVKYVLILAFAIVLLNGIQARMYPNARWLFRSDNVTREQYYMLNPFDLSWRTLGRFSLIARAVPLYGVVAPTPFVLTKELGTQVPNFRTYQILLGEFHIASYHGLGDITVKFWIVLLAAAGLLFLWQFFRSPKQVLLPLSLLVCVGFSFALHLVYGDDPMLYSPNWTYALVLFVALALQRWADRKWLQLLLILFLVMLLTTNLGLIYQILRVSAPFYGAGS